MQPDLKETIEPNEYRELLLLKAFGLLDDSQKYLNPSSKVTPEEGPVKCSANLESFVDICATNNQRWERETQHRIEVIFNCTRKDLELCHQNKRLTKAQNLHVDNEFKCSILLRLFAITIPDFGYDARVGVIMESLRLMTDVPRDVYVYMVEHSMAEQIKSGYLHEQQDLEAQSTKTGTLKKNLLIGIGALTGAIALGVTAGLAAPVVIPAFASLFGVSAASAAFLTGATATAVFAAVFGAGGAGLAGYKMERRYQNVSSFQFLPITTSDQMRVAIGISGWLTDDKDIYQPWLGLSLPGIDLFVLEVEKERFKALGSALGNLITISAVGFATSEILKTTALATAMAALAWPVAILQAGSLIDNPWSVCVNIAERSGMILADAIKKRAHGHRPITLAGYSLGALTIFHCLKELTKDPDANMGVIEHVILLGLPAIISSREDWARMRMLIAGRFIHCYSQNDWVLRFLYRSTALTASDIAGLSPLPMHGIENINMSNFVKGHLEYAEKTLEMLEMFNL